MLVERVNETAVAVLEALVTYRFLTAAQLHRLGISRSQRHVYSTLRTLAPPRQARTAKDAPARRRLPPIDYLEFGVLPGIGRLPALYFLTPHGAELLAEAQRQEKPAPVPERVRLFRNDYFHRVNCVDFHIALRQDAARFGMRLDFFHVYFDHSAAPRGRPEPKTRVALRQGALIPDAIFALTPQDGRQRLYAFEMYNGRETGRVERQLATYLEALDQEAIERAYRYEHGARVLCVFDQERGLALAQERLVRRPEFKPFAEYFLWKTLREAMADVLTGWRQVGERWGVPLFPQG
jgi:hypothetical protein